LYDSTQDSGVVQVETFGVSLNAEGTCFYGMQVEAVMDRIKDNISLDHLARLLVDVQQDSSSIVDSIISQYQRDLLDLIFLGDAPNRNKVNLIIANEITPHLTVLTQRLISQLEVASMASARSHATAAPSS
jgi:hypothetical protein